MKTEPRPDAIQEATPVVGGNEQVKGGLPSLSSDALLQGQKAVTISHNGSVYRLQATRQGKLILTK